MKLNLIQKLKLLYYLNKLWEEMTNMNWKDPKTTVSGIVVTVGVLLRLFNVELPTQVSDGLIALGVFLIGFFAKDSK